MSGLFLCYCFILKKRDCLKSKLVIQRPEFRKYQRRAMTYFKFYGASVSPVLYKIGENATCSFTTFYKIRQW